jgi:hypothetical protein
VSSNRRRTRSARLAYWLAEELALSFRVEPRAAGTAGYTDLMRRMLIGQPLVRSARAVDMEIFGFGEIRTALGRWHENPVDVSRVVVGGSPGTATR